MKMKLKILTHSGLETEVEVEKYDALDINNKLNNAELNTILVGDIILSRIDVKLILPIFDSNTRAE